MASPTQYSSALFLDRRGQRGLTRVELLLGIAGLGIVGLLAGWLTWGGTVADHESTARERGQTLLHAAQDWKRAHSDPGCPSITQLRRETLLKETARAEDPWGQRYRILCTEAEIQVRSAGGDRQFQTADDITLAVQPNS